MKSILEEKKAIDLEVIALEGKSLLADYFVVCSGTSNIHIKAIADGMLMDGRDAGVRKEHIEGYTDAKWVLVDYGDIVVHIFAAQEREYYDLESLWKETAIKLGSES